MAVKRLQSECEHRVELERVKYTALKEQHSVLEKRLTTVNVALANLEKEFYAYKSEHCKTSEAELTGQVMLLKQQCNDLKRNCEKALRMKTDYKVQVCLEIAIPLLPLFLTISIYVYICIYSRQSVRCLV